MFCYKCGKAFSEKDNFCSSCGAKKLAFEAESKTDTSIPLKSVNEDAGNDEQQETKGITVRITKKWMIISMTLVVVIACIVILYRNNIITNQDPANIVPAISNMIEEHSGEIQPTVKDNPITTEQNKELNDNNPPIEKKKSAIYIRVNQVDSSRYENGQVDVYFSLFRDQLHSESIELEQLVDTMFKVDQGTVQHVARVEDEDQVSVNLVIDKSGSMLEYTPYNQIKTKMQLVKEAAITFLENIPSDAKGNFEVISFSGYAPEYPDVEFTSNRQSVINYLSHLESDGGSTALYDTLTKALYETDAQSGPKYIIAFTDGMDSDYGSSADSVVDLSLQLGIPIYTVGFGEDFSELQEISEQTGGIAFVIDREHDLQTELENIYQEVFDSYVKQYKLVYKPKEQVSPGESFDVVVYAETDEYIGESYEQSFTRKIDATSINVMNSLFDYQINYAKAVNFLDFYMVGGNVFDDITNDKDFYNNLKNRIEIDYVKLYENGTPKYIEAIENYKTEKVEKLSNDLYKIQFFKLFPVVMDNKMVYEADLNTYTLKKDNSSGEWKVSDFARNECSIYDEENGTPRSCKSINGVEKLYTKNPWD